MIYGVAHILTHGDPVPEELENEYIQRYGEIVDAINEGLNDRNEEWHSDFWFGPMKENTREWDCYGQFLSGWESVLCCKNNMEPKYRNSRIFMDAIPDKGEPKIIAIIDRDRDHYLETRFDMGRSFHG